MTVAVRIRFGHLDYMPRCTVTRLVSEFCHHCDEQPAGDVPHALKGTPDTAGGGGSAGGRGRVHDILTATGGQHNHAR